MCWWFTLLYLSVIPLVFSTSTFQQKILEWNPTNSTNSTGHFIFNTISDLLQHWPNTRYRNGHTIVPASLPPGTLLYHGTFVPQIPSTPEWTSVDPEHSYFFCHGYDGKGCWHLTLVATRTLRLLYFDGSSAAKHDGGALDAQDLLLWGDVQRERQTGLPDDILRLQELCKLGEETGQRYDGFDGDGFVRNVEGFKNFTSNGTFLIPCDSEIMLCNFTSGVEPISFLNLATPLDRREPLGLQNISSPWNLGLGPLEDDIAPIFFATLESGSWSDRFPGNARIQLDLTRFISFYDVDMFPSLISLREGKDRWYHRLEGMSKEDVAALRKEVGSLKVEPKLERTGDDFIHSQYTSAGSGVNWAALVRTIKNRYTERLDVLQYLLTERLANASAEVTVRNVATHVRRILTPYILHNVTPPSSEDPSVNSTPSHTWLHPIYMHCAATHTAYISGLTLTRSERLILKAIQEVNEEICHVLVDIWGEETVYFGNLIGDKPAGNHIFHGTTRAHSRREDDEPRSFTAAELVHRWKKSVYGLMTWLDWSEWVRCSPQCGFEQMCALPTWPFAMVPQERYPETSYASLQQRHELAEQRWARPKPGCLRRISPFKLYNGE